MIARARTRAARAFDPKAARWQRRCGFSLIECLFAVGVAAVVFLSTLALLGFARLHNANEQERTRAHEIVCQHVEVERHKLFTWTASARNQTVWDNGTPDNLTDDTIGVLEVIVRDPATGASFTSAPNPAQLVEIEATITWHPRGRMAGKILRETAIVYDAP
ncbi:MAG TPA: hypothetical protein VM492_18335 [Sumerlaeia bacterium]|nr:hypothetical protein [Sumerlaeia bacterium]